MQPINDSNQCIGWSHHALIESVERFCLDQIKPIANNIDETDKIPRQLWQEMGNLGLLGVTIEQEFGGINAGYGAHTRIMEIISQYSAALGLSYAAHSNLCLNQIQRFANDMQKNRFIPDLVSGKKVGALCLSEVDAGSDAGSIRLQADYNAGHFTLNGHKMWITNGSHADTLIVYAKTQPTLGWHGITAFILDADSTGILRGRTINKLGMRGSGTCELIFNNCIVPETHVLGEVNQGVHVLMSGLDIERVVLAAGPVGIMQACLDCALPYVCQRQQFKQPIGNFQLIQAKIADMYTALMSSRHYVYAMAASCDNGTLSKEAAASVILHTSEAATRIALETIQCLGGNGYTNEYPAHRFLRDAKLYEIGAGTSEIRRTLIGKALIKKQAN